MSLGLSFYAYRSSVPAFAYVVLREILGFILVVNLCKLAFCTGKSARACARMCVRHGEFVLVNLSL